MRESSSRFGRPRLKPMSTGFEVSLRSLCRRRRLNEVMLLRMM